MSSYWLDAISFIAIFIALTAVLYLQSSIGGIANFGIVGFYGLAMYMYTLLNVKLGFAPLWSLLIVVGTVFVVSLAFGRVILNLGPQSILVATLAFATIIRQLVTVLEPITGGAKGVGTVKMPWDFEKTADEKMLFMGVLIVLAVLLLLYAAKVKRTPYGRLMLSIKDNEPLSASLGKSTLNHKVIYFAFTCAIIGLFGALTAPIYTYIFPYHILSDVTFVVWIALLVGGRMSVWGAVVGIAVTKFLFDFGIESLLSAFDVRMGPQFSSMYPNIKLALFGAMLIAIFMFRPNGIISKTKRKGIHTK
jgi:branched-chain amino acid transport system permease protein